MGGGGLFCCCSNVVVLEVFLQELNTSMCVNQREACLSRCAYQQHSSCRDSKFQRDTGTRVLKDEDITALFTMRRGAWEEEVLDNLPGRMRKLHHLSDQCWNCLKGNTGDTSERLDRVLMGFPERIDTTMIYIGFGSLHLFFFLSLSNSPGCGQSLEQTF